MDRGGVQNGGRTMEKKSDLRVSKTLRAIHAAFLELMVKKPVQKITVTELAQRAEISKGTFYLHYADIFDLYRRLVHDTVDKIAKSFDPYPELFTDPEAFVRTFLFSQVEPLREGLTPGEYALLLEKNSQHCSDYPQCFIDAFKAQIYRVGKLVPCEENDIKLEFLLTGMLSVVVRYRPQARGDAEQREFVIRFLTAVVKETFPEFYRAPAP